MIYREEIVGGGEEKESCCSSRPHLPLTLPLNRSSSRTKPRGHPQGTSRTSSFTREGDTILSSRELLSDSPRGGASHWPNPRVQDWSRYYLGSNFSSEKRNKKSYLAFSYCYKKKILISVFIIEH